MLMKCIGGLANGQIVEVDSYLGEHDLVRVMAKVQFNIIDFDTEVEAFRNGKTLDSMSIPYYYYKISILHFPSKQKLRFLIPTDLSAENALCFVLGA